MSRLLSWLTGARLIATGMGLTPTNLADLAGLKIDEFKSENNN